MRLHDDAIVHVDVDNAEDTSSPRACLIYTFLVRLDPDGPVFAALENAIRGSAGASLSRFHLRDRGRALAACSSPRSWAPAPRRDAHQPAQRRAAPRQDSNTQAAAWRLALMHLPTGSSATYPDSAALIDLPVQKRAEQAMYHVCHYHQQYDQHHHRREKEAHRTRHQTIDSFRPDDGCTGRVLARDGMPPEWPTLKTLKPLQCGRGSSNQMNSHQNLNLALVGLCQPKQ